MTDTLETGRALAERLHPGMEAALDARYGELLPGMAEAVVDFAFGRHCARPGLPLRERHVATIAAQGGGTRPQLKVDIAGARRAGLGREEIAEAIWRMALHGGLPDGHQRPQRRAGGVRGGGRGPRRVGARAVARIGSLRSRWRIR